jgi:trimeric autotransporter adhesin
MESTMRTATMPTLAVILIMFAGAAQAVGSRFTYQGHLEDLAQPAHGVYDFQLDIYAHPSVGAPLNPVPLLFDDVAVDEGVFALEIDFGASVFTGADRWLAIRVRPGAATGPFTALLPRQPITATPYAQHAGDAAFAASVAAGSIGASHIDPSEVQRRITSPCAAGQAIRAIAADGGVTCVAIATSSGWQLGGNAGIDPAQHFLGTLDAQPLLLRVDNQRVARIEPLRSDGSHGGHNLVFGHADNGLRDGVIGATIGGGGGNAEGAAAPNEVRSHGGTVAGGAGNIAGHADFEVDQRRYASVGGGLRNTARHRGATVAGGLDNIAGGLAAVIGGGSGHWSGGSHASVAGGQDNAAPEGWTAIPGGILNCAGGRYSFAAGRRAKVRPASPIPSLPACAGVAAAGGLGDQGSFVWADSRDFDFASSGSNQFRARATGGVTFVTGIDASGAATSGVQLNAGAGSWTSLSDRNAKTDITDADPVEVLARLLELPIHRWRYRGEPEQVRHLGPMAQDFHASFGLNGSDDTGIATVDAQGVALAAIQGLHARVEAENAALRGEIEALRIELALLREMLAARAQPLR